MENREFEDKLNYIGYSRGRSSVTFEFEGSGGEIYRMLVRYFNELLVRKGIMNCELFGKWTFVKRGQNFGIKLVEEGDD